MIYSDMNQQELPREALQKLQQIIEVLLGISVIMALSRSPIGRIKIEERIRHVPAFDDPEGIA
ncbi:MAG: hypothetical protein LBE17_09795, partial [Treponema sp.]|nr:hypothetical protein [Treponema sp.]